MVNARERGEIVRIGSLSIEWHYNSMRVPTDLPLLEALCWNIKYPYQLSTEDMLGIYQRYWRFNGVLANPSQEEVAFIKELSNYYNSYPLMAENREKLQHYDYILEILQSLDSQLLEDCQVYLGGGALSNLELGCYRYSQDIDFICSDIQGYRNLRVQIAQLGLQSLFSKLDKIQLTSSPLMDQYGIRFPVKVAPDIQIKLEIITEARINLESPIYPSWCHIPSLNIGDRFALKLLANADRYLDHRSYSRDLIDLSLYRNSDPIPPEAIAKADVIYPVIEPLIEAITNFQSQQDYRDNCYQQLQIDNPVIVIDGLDLLAKDFELYPTERTLKETDFSYLE